MSVTDLFAIGASGTRAYRAAMGAVSENIANASTEGYNRRSLLLMESPSSATTSQFYRPGINFGGVEIASVARANNPYLDLAARLADSSFQNADARAQWMSDVQNALDDGSLGVGQRLTAMFSAVERLAANPTDTTLRQNVLFAFEQINYAFQLGFEGLSNIQAGIASTAANGVVALNDAVGQLATANEGLRRAVPGSPNAAQLLDQRDLALANIARQIDATVTFGDHGVANVTYNGADVVAGIVPSTFAVSANANGTLAFTLDGAAVPVPQNGALAGLARSAAVTADRKVALDALASQYVADVNAWHQGGRTAAGNPGQPMLSIGADAATLALLISDPADIAGASADGRVNGNLLAISNIRGTSGIENGWSSIIAAQANLLNATKAEQAATSARNQQAQNARADVSGVDLDREAADLLRLQQAYQGSARIIQVARETLDSLFAAL
ncbi:MAG TPA: flagellar hook-associated protein FlgK [Sphingobium sp.]|nr:flagellar hook-associated protein FlgK [Sphingobium sp.]